MSVQPIPPPIEHLGQRPFSFYPPILNTEHNEWIFRRATWSEILVCNTKTNNEIWVPRRLIGEISRIEEPVMILGLLKELEYKAGQVLPSSRRVIEIPRAVNDGFRLAPQDAPASPAPVVGIRLESGTESRIGKLIGVVLVVGILGCFFLISFFRSGRDGSRITYTPLVQTSLGLAASDDYFAVVRKMGKPASDHWKSETGEMQYRILTYPDQGISIILMGAQRDKALYIGAVDSNWHPVDSVALPNGGSTSSMLKSLQRF
ncbi:MAG: hypothetical protein ABJF23_32470 [Bryobacteraceae bacterium]